MRLTLSPLEFLVSVGADRARHTERSLLDHLVGTEKMLREWQCEPYVCRAGLFHSIYSTSIYDHASVSLERRAEVASVISHDAEQLAYLFCIAKRPTGLLQAIDDLAILSRFDGSHYAILPVTLMGLIEIECANLLEQGSGESFLRRLVERAFEGSLPLRRIVIEAVERRTCSRS